MAVQRTGARTVVHYTDATQSAFQKTIDGVARALPLYSAALKQLLAEGAFHDVARLRAALEADSDE